jgi:hypothetical protein
VRGHRDQGVSPGLLELPALRRGVQTMIPDRTIKLVTLGPLTVSSHHWEKVKAAIHQAFVEWDAWSGLAVDGDKKDEYRAMVAKVRAHVFALIAELEKA